MIWIVAIVVVGIGLLLIVPLSVDIAGAVGDEQLWARAEARWGLGLASVHVGEDAEARLSIVGVPVARFSERPRSHNGKASADWRRWAPKTRWTKLASTHRHTVGRMVRRTIEAIHAHAQVYGTLGFEDPAHTAFALMGAQQLNRIHPERFRLDLHDDYLDEATQLFGRFQAWMVPAEIIVVLIGWSMRRDTRRVLRGG